MHGADRINTRHHTHIHISTQADDQQSDDRQHKTHENKRSAHSRACLSRMLHKLSFMMPATKMKNHICEKLLNVRCCQRSPCAELSAAVSKQSSQRAPAKCASTMQRAINWQQLPNQSPISAKRSPKHEGRITVSKPCKVPWNVPLCTEE